MLGAAGGHVSYTPETEYQMGLGWPSIRAARDAGVNVQRRYRYHGKQQRGYVFSIAAASAS